MRVTLNDNRSQQEKEIEYPLLAKNTSNNMIAYFISEHVAVILDKGDSQRFKTGSYYDNFYGVKCYEWEILTKGVTITLEND